ncbi:MAG TPA: uracil-DNA glycosylase [Anaerolineae bacterium]|nr:uracil-DNA glycosylase [Anaerolineae bacterium]
MRVSAEAKERLLARLFELLVTYEGDGTFNQYRDYDPQLGKPSAPEIRRRNVRRYLESFSDASYLLVGEAAGYAGCRFSGIPFTGEAQIVGPERLPWAQGLDLQQSSLGEAWRERSGTIVWDALGGRRDCALWNAFPWHPHGEDPLSNRRPTQGELDSAAGVLRCILTFFGIAQVYAIGRVSEAQLHRLGTRAPYVRHPSHGGKSRFVASVQSLPRR